MLTYNVYKIHGNWVFFGLSLTWYGIYHALGWKLIPLQKGWQKKIWDVVDWEWCENGLFMDLR